MTILFCVAVFLAYTVKGMSGFANTLILSSILSFRVNNLDITPLDLVLSLPSNLYLAWKDRKKLNLRVCAPMAICAVLGALPGVFLLKWGDAAVLKIAMGVLIALIGIENALRGQMRSRKASHPAALIFVGILSGIVSGVFGIGALMVAYINRYSESNSEFRGNICFIFAADNLFRLFMYIPTGVLTWPTVLRAITLLPCTALGLFLGAKLANRLGDAAARRITSWLLIFSGLSVILTNLMKLL